MWLKVQIVNIAGEDLLQRHFPKVELWKGLALEGLANRDAIPYAEKYGLGEVHGLTNLFRGTLRWVSSCFLSIHTDQFRWISADFIVVVQQGAKV